MNSFYSEAELAELGLKSYGKDVKISRRCSIYSPSTISIESHVRIDDFCILSGELTLGNYIHISAYSALYGGGRIVVADYCTISPRCTLFSASDDFSGDFLVGAQFNKELTNVKSAPIILNRFVNIGSGCIVMPGIEFGEGTAVGAASLVRDCTPEWSICWGVPCKFRRNRNRKMVSLTKDLG